MRTSTVAGTVILALLVAVELRAADPVDSKALDHQLSDTLKDVHNRGADLYNSNLPNDCYRLFQGALMTVRPLLGHHPKAQAIIDKGMQAADTLPTIEQRAFKLHETIEQVRTELKNAPAARPASKPPGGSSAPARPMGGTPAGPGGLPKVTATTSPKPPANSSPAPKTPETKPEVSGTVTLNGKPLAKASVTFISSTDDTKLFSTVTDAAGAFKVTTIQPGTYRIAVSATSGGRELVPAKYSDRKKSSLTTEVPAQGPKVLKFDLTS